ncbi:MAG: crossover junction endodeoxyribonuclease RuvC [Bradymonadia bacterium]
MSTTPQRVLGIDPGTRFCGWGIVDADGPHMSHVDNGVVVLGDSAPLAKRLSILLDRLSALIDEYQPTAAACEGVFQHKNARSALILGHARGVALAVMAKAGLDVKEYTPMQIKKAVCGHGRAGKLQVQHMVSMRLGLNEVPQEDAADAVAVALCHGQNLAFGADVRPNVQIPHRPRHLRGRAALAALAGAPPPRNQSAPFPSPGPAGMPPGLPPGVTPGPAGPISSKVRIIAPRPVHQRPGKKIPQEDP